MTDKPRIPNIEERVRLLGTLLRIDTPKPIQPPDEYVFEDVDARVEIRMGDRVLKECGTFCDWYGCAVTSGIKEALEVCENMGLTPTSDVEVVVIKVTSQIRKHLSRDKAPYTYAKEFRRFDRMEYGCCWDLAADVEEEVWSSKVAEQ